MIRVLLVSIVAMVAATVAQESRYKEYGKYDLRDALMTKKADDGKDEHGLDMVMVSKVIDDLATHAKNYPPTFRSEDERTRAERDAKILVYLLDMIAAGDEVEAGILLMAGFVNAIGHNLDIEGSAEKATAYFERLLKREPDHPMGNFHYGVFLASTAAGQKKSLPYLEKALKLGVENAGFSLGLAYLMLGEKAKSLEYLESYSEKNPDDQGAKEIIEAIKSGKIKVQREGQ